MRMMAWLAAGAVCSLGVFLVASCNEEPRCGDDVIDPGEVCDDGNTVAGDGCRPDCTGIEVCGDGLRDPCEECDEGGETVTCDADRSSLLMEAMRDPCGLHGFLSLPGEHGIPWLHLCPVGTKP